MSGAWRRDVEEMCGRCGGLERPNATGMARVSIRVGHADVVSSVRRAKVEPSIAIAVFAFLVLLVLALFGERLAPHETIYFVLEHPDGERPFDPGLVYPFGSDVLGRDIFSLVLAGARATLTIVLLAGLARVIAGVLVAAIGSWWRPTRLATEAVAELFSSIPATLVALLLVKVFVRSDTTVLVFIAALLVIGWAGPYRVIRAEVDRLQHAAFTEGALAIGVGRWRLFWRHHVPHLIPVIAVNLSQQVVASLILVAELGVLGVVVGPSRLINVEESLSRFQVGPANAAVIADEPEWGGLLAGSRTISALWTTRWLILVPGIAFAFTAIAVAAIGFALARRYARRDLLTDLVRPGSGVFGLILVGLFLLSVLLPERYAPARDWADDAREQVGSTRDTARALSEAGLVPMAPEYAVREEGLRVYQTAPARVSIGSAIVEDEWPARDREPTEGDPLEARSVLMAGTSGGSVEAPLVFVGRGIVPSDHPQTAQVIGAAPRPALGTLIRSYANDYARVDVRGKVVLLTRFLGVAARGRNSARRDYVLGPAPEDSIMGAIERGAAAVIFVDPALPFYSELARNAFPWGRSPYLRLEREQPPLAAAGVPVMVLSGEAASSLVAPLGIDLSPYLDFDEPDQSPFGPTTCCRPSPARDLGVTAHVEVPLAGETAVRTSFIGEAAGLPDTTGRVLVWARRSRDAAHPAADVIAALARVLASRNAPFVLVDFDPATDPGPLLALLRERPISLVIVLDGLEGEALRFTTPYGDLIPAFDLYAERAGARYEVTRETPAMGALAGVAPFADVRTIVIRGDEREGDLRPDAAALLGYLAGRYALGAPEVPQ